MKKHLSNYLPIIITAPAIVIGAIAMYINNIPSYIYMQNILCFIILGGVSYFVLKNEYKLGGYKPHIFIIVSIIALLGTFINLGIENVQRWVSIGPIKFYVSSIVLPIIIINLWRLFEKGKNFIASASIICVSIILILQPDASMITAFNISIMIILLYSKIKTSFKSLIVIFLSMLIIISWIFLDKLAPVSYVEGIVMIIRDMGFLWFILGIIALIVLVIPFIVFSPKKDKLLSRCIGIYFVMILISTLFGNFPVPLMGYGVSPIIGYFISITWFAKNKFV